MFQNICSVVLQGMNSVAATGKTIIWKSQRDTEKTNVYWKQLKGLILISDI